MSEIKKVIIGSSIIANKIPTDMVNQPAHYTQSAIEAIVYLEDSLGDGFNYYLEGSLKKYLHRWRYKDPTKEGKIRDLEKAKYYLEALIEDVRTT